jgi:hypothetical protein
MKPATRWSVVKPSGEVRGNYTFKEDADIALTFHPGTVIECTILPTADLERLVRAARTIASEIDTPVTVHTSEAIAELDNALTPFTGDADAN